MEKKDEFTVDVSNDEMKTESEATKNEVKGADNVEQISVEQLEEDFAVMRAIDEYKRTGKYPSDISRTKKGMLRKLADKYVIRGKFFNFYSINSSIQLTVLYLVNFSLGSKIPPPPLPLP